MDRGSNETIILKKSLTALFALLLIGILTKHMLIQLLAGVIAYSLLIEFKPVLNLAVRLVDFLHRIGKTLLSVVLSVLYIVLIAPYAMIVRLFSTKHVPASTWQKAAEAPFSKGFFTRPW